VLLSLLAHLTLVAVVKFVDRPPVRVAPGQVEVEYIRADDLIPADESLADKKAKTKAKQKDLDQIVEQQKQLNDEIDDKTRYLSAFNQKVIRETRALNSGKFTNTAEGGKPIEGQNTGDKKSELSKKTQSQTTPKGELPDLKDLTPKFALEPGPRGLPLDKDGNPSQTDDYLKEVNKGMQTLLSTREFVYYAYYSRIKELLRQHWEPTVREKVKIIYRTGRNIASAKDRITQVLVTLNADGELLRVDVLSASGVTDLDAAAIESFKNASPFPNPPKGMIEKDGTVKIRWDFVLEV
jgi:TonB family protein